MDIKFQPKLLEIVNNFTLSSIPHSLLLKGLKGSGRHSIVKYISQELDLPLVNLNEELNDEIINELYSKTTQCIYLVDLNELNFKSQNSLLKILEEPTPYLYFILLADYKTVVLGTVENRCFILNTEPYSKEDLKEFVTKDKIDKDLILTLSETPGDVIFLQDQDLEGMKELAYKIVHMMGKASFPNALSISDKMAYKNEKNKYDLLTFISVYQKEMLEEMRQNPTKLNMLIFDKLSILNGALRLKNINQKYIFENFITTLWKISQSKVENNGN